MKILFISHLAKNMLLFRSALLKELAEEGHDIYVLCPYDQDCTRFKDLGAQWIDWKFTRKSGLLNAAKAFIQMINLFRTLNPDRVVAYMIQPILLANMACIIQKVSLISVFTGLGTIFIQQKKIKHKVRFLIISNILRIVLKMSQKIVVLNRDDYAELLNLKLSNQLQLELIPGEGIDLERFKSENLNLKSVEKYREKLKSNNQKVILYLGRFIAEKGILDFKYIAEFFKDRKDLLFVAVGEIDPGNPSSLSKKELQELKQSVIVFNWIDDVPELLANVDLLLYPSVREGFPVGLMEAMASGVSVVAYDVPGVRDAMVQFKEYLFKCRAELVDFVEQFKPNHGLDWQKASQDFDIKKINQIFKGCLL